MPFRSPSQRARTPQRRGRFPGFDVLDSVEAWDDVTAGIVLARLAPAADYAFFTLHEAGIAVPLLDLLLAQDADPRVPVAALIDARLAVGETDGWHYDDLPEDAQGWRDSLAALDEDARTGAECGFADLASSAQATLVQGVQDLAAAHKPWRDRSAEHIWSLWTRYSCTAFYSHPWAWNEIGFPGPAYPRGYLNLGAGARERWEVADQHAGDPVPFAHRVERARHEHTQLLGHAQLDRDSAS